MKPKTVVTAVILAFVAVSIGYLIVKEVRAARISEAPPAIAAERESGPREAAASGEALDDGITPAAADRKVVVTYYYNTAKR